MTAWNLSLFNDEPTPYGPNPDRPAIIPARGNVKQIAMRSEGIVTHGVSIALADATYNKAGNAPPLDWWVIADEVCVCGFQHDALAVREGEG